uniref:Uncharacterized protein AlNc14C74G5030 n=1 Tax=Albugo laibachii Nc14 TaxID=890382 RepID=F0WEH7_9STRA|nr:hypothetical protein PANDA_002987 [Albugo laibachii Nc14]|eukprot:CCA19609.1 hypothetical protein PANDA_002987 [Albugo laibachii Nc14]
MFIYLSKKIAIPNNVKIHCCSWNSDQGWIVCGGESGLLKVLRLESVVQPHGKGPCGIAASSNLTMNQTLEGHHDSVICATWNSIYRKLTTSDENGLIIVWVLHRGIWYEEMVNNRNKSIVRDMKWSSDGKKICIAYEDGAVIVGSVDGSRLWGKEMKTKLMLVEWSPDGKIIVFVTANGEITVHDAQGNKISNLTLYALEGRTSAGPDNCIVGLHWYDGCEGHVTDDAPTLAVAFRDGKVQITRGRFDENAVLIDTGIELTQCKWNNDGTVIALTGTQYSSGDKNKDAKALEYNVVQFYDPFGQHLRSLRVPGSRIEALAWEGSGLRVCLAVGSHIYFANIRPAYKWGYYCDTLVYTYNRVDQVENVIIFWNIKTGERYNKFVKDLVQIHATGENCVLVSKCQDEDLSEDVDPVKEKQSQMNLSERSLCVLTLCDTIGSPIETKQLVFEPRFATMTSRHIVAASEDVIYVWQYRTPNAKLSGHFVGNSIGNSSSKDPSTEHTLSMSHMLQSADTSREKIFHIEDTQGSDLNCFRYTSRHLEDPICAICASDSWIMVARASGFILCFTLPHISLEMKYIVNCRPQMLSLNCDSTRLSVIDINGIMTIMEVGQPGDLGAIRGKMLDFEKKDTWDMKWADDNPELFVVMEKARMHILGGPEPEEPSPSSGYLCSFTSLQVKAALLDDILVNPERPDKAMVMDFETRSLRDARDILENSGLQEACDYIQAHPHPRLWSLLAETALANLDFSMAQRGFIKSNDYLGIQYVKRLHLLNDKVKQRAEVAAYFQQFDEAEALYRKIDRKDLAIELRQRIGDWFRVVQLLQSNNPEGNDEELINAYNMIGEYYVERQKWEKAIRYYTQSRNIVALARCLHKLGDYNQLELLVQELPQDTEILREMAVKFARAGMCDSAVDVYLRLNDINSAIDVCVSLNEWERAVSLAEDHNFPEIEKLLSKYATHLISNEKMIQAIELYRRANKSSEAAVLLGTLAKQIARHPLKAKKLLVLAALEVDRMRNQLLDTDPTRAQATAQTLESLVQYDAATGENRILDNPWRGAEAYHLFLLAHRQLYANEIERAFRTSIKLASYDDILENRDIYSLIALTSLQTKHFDQCSRAFIKLENDTGISEKGIEQIKVLALEIFMKNRPVDPTTRPKECPYCHSYVKEWDYRCNNCARAFLVCMVTGASILEQRAVSCRSCKHYTLEQELRGRNTCALCHSFI